MGVDDTIQSQPLDDEWQEGKLLWNYDGALAPWEFEVDGTAELEQLAPFHGHLAHRQVLEWCKN